MDTGLLPIGTIDVLKFAQKQLAEAAKVDFGDGLGVIRDQSSIRYSVRKITAVNYMLIIAVPRLQLNVDRDDEC